MGKASTTSPQSRICAFPDAAGRCRSAIVVNLATVARPEAGRPTAIAQPCPAPSQVMLSPQHSCARLPIVESLDPPIDSRCPNASHPEHFNARCKPMDNMGEQVFSIYLRRQSEAIANTRCLDIARRWNTASSNGDCYLLMQELVNHSDAEIR